MKKFFYMISAALFSLTLCFSCAFALDYKNPNDYLDYEEVYFTFCSDDVLGVCRECPEYGDYDRLWRLHADGCNRLPR